MQQWLVRLVLFVLLAGLGPAWAQQQHPDLAGLLALKATICGNCTELLSWTPTGSICSSFDGVYCGWALGAWRVVGVQLQLDAAGVALNDSAMAPGGVLAGLDHLRELEVLCVTHRPPSPDPPKPSPTPSNAPQQQRQQEQQQQQHVSLLRRELQQGAASAGFEGLLLSRWLAASEAQQPAASIPNMREQQQLQPQQIQQPLPQHEQQQPPQQNQQPLPQHKQQQPPQQQQQQYHSQRTDRNSAPGGELPSSWFVAYPRLSHLRVVGCGAGGELAAAPVGEAKHLESLVLSHNSLRGPLPDVLAQLKGLSVLDLSANQLSGSLPLSWVQLQHLHYLYLNNNNLTGVLPCEFTQLQLLLADLSGNEWHASPLPGELGCEGHAMVPGAAAAAAVEGGVSGGSWGAGTNSQQWQRQDIVSSSNSSSSRSAGRQLGQHLVTAATGGPLTAPRCWLRRFCYDEGAFICLQRRGKAAAGGCSSYVYGASDLHIDPLNQCDHGGSHLAAITAMFTAFGTALLLIWLHHCRLMRWMNQPGSSSSAAEQHRQQQQQQQTGPWQQRQWLISGPSPPSRARHRSLGGGTGAAADLNNSGGSGGLKEPLLSQAPPHTLPLLYRPAKSEHEGAGYSSPVSSSSAAADAFVEAAPTAAVIGTPDGVLPSALTTPSAGAISIRPQQGRGGRGQQGGFGRRAVSDKGLEPGGSRARGLVEGGRNGRRGLAAGDSSQQDAGSASGYESDTSSAAGVSGGGDATITAHLSAAWLKPGYYFHGNEPLPPWAGGVARVLAVALAPARSSSIDGGGGDGSSGCFQGALVLPLVFLLADVVTNLRLLLLWGVGPPAHVKLWPSYALLGLLCVPHVLVGAVVNFRLLAVACLPPALKAAAISEDQLLSQDIAFPPGSKLLVGVYSWLFGAPAWLAYPLILLLLAPGVVLLTLLCPLVLLAACCGLGSTAGVVRYIQLLQGCTAMTQSAGSAVLLTVLFLMGNVPLEWAFLDSSLYYLTAFADLANISVAWWMRVAAVRRQHELALAALPGSAGQQWT